jgi:hypothetical protein
VDEFPHARPLLVVHHAEINRHVPVRCERRDGRCHAVLDLVAERAARHGEHDGERHPVRGDGDVTHHPEVHDGTVQLGVLHRTQCIDDLLNRGGHGDSSWGIRPK